MAFPYSDFSVCQYYVSVLLCLSTKKKKISFDHPQLFVSLHHLAKKRKKNMGLINIAIFASGNGSNCENLIRHFEDSCLANCTLVVSNKPDAYVLVRARKLDVPTAVVTKEELNNPNVMLPLLQEHNISFIVLAGFLPLIPLFLVDAFPRCIINLHPALLPKYGGKGMWGRHVHEAVKEAGETETGMTVHYVTPVCDAGEIIAQYRVAISPTDTVDDIAEKEHQLEIEYFPQVVEKVLLQKNNEQQIP